MASALVLASGFLLEFLPRFLKNSNLKDVLDPFSLSAAVVTEFIRLTCGLC